MWESGATETFFVVASVDMEHVEIMTTRIRSQLERNAGFKTKTTLRINAAPVEITPPGSPQSLAEQVHGVASEVTEMIMASMASRQIPGNSVTHFN